MSNFGEFLSYMLVVFVFFTYLMILWIIIGDIFRDRELSGWLKGLWIVALIVFPWITALIYFISRGKGMQDRAIAEAKAMNAAQQEYIREAAGSSGPADQIATAKALLDSGAISQEEFNALKAKALS